MEVVYASGVLEEVVESSNYYEEEVEGLGKAFLDKIESAIEDIKCNPLMYRIVTGDYRRHLLNRFPFAIVYRIENGKMYVLAVMHLKREPFYWKTRQTN
jgi:toxin ParE1/3/4